LYQHWTLNILLRCCKSTHTKRGQVCDGHAPTCKYSLKFIITLFSCFFKPLCKTLKQPKVSSLACPCVSHMSFKQYLKLPSRHLSIVGSIKGKFLLTFLCFLNLKCHSFVFVFFVASVVATPQSLSYLLFFFF
jgi:hypothetical protein